jgi:hypothetical protein
MGTEADVVRFSTFGRDTRRRFALGLIRAEDEIVDRLALRKPRRQSFRVERLADRIGGEGGRAHERARILGLHQGNLKLQPVAIRIAILERQRRPVPDRPRRRDALAL